MGGGISKLTAEGFLVIIKVWNPNGCRNIVLHQACEAIPASQTREPSGATDGSLLFAVEFIPRLIENPGDRDNPKRLLKCYVYHLLGEKFPPGLYTCLPSAPAG